jgi:hypothetical protein
MARYRLPQCVHSVGAGRCRGRCIGRLLPAGGRVSHVMMIGEQGKMIIANTANTEHLRLPAPVPSPRLSLMYAVSGRSSVLTEVAEHLGRSAQS